MKAAVTGGTGFLGAALVRALLARGHQVTVVARGASGEESGGPRRVAGDVRDAALLEAAFAGHDVVFHTAAKAGGWGRPADFDSINVQGTANVLAACRAAGVRHLVYTSTPSVVHTGQDIEGGDESLPYATHFLADYPRTKAAAERLVRQASDAALRTISLRPHLIWGPGDTQLLPRLVSRARAGRLRQVGQRETLVDVTYIDNAVHAHLLAWEALKSGLPLGGRVYFVSDGEPVGRWAMVRRMLAAAGAPPLGGPVSVGLAQAAAWLAEASYRLTGRTDEPPLTRFAVSQLAHAQWYSLRAARADLGYAPVVDLETGLLRLAESLHDGA